MNNKMSNKVNILIQNYPYLIVHTLLMWWFMAIVYELQDICKLNLNIFRSIYDYDKIICIHYNVRWFTIGLRL